MSNPKIFLLSSESSMSMSIFLDPSSYLCLHAPVGKQEKDDPMEDEETMLRRMRRLTDYYDVHKEIGR